MTENTSTVTDHAGLIAFLQARELRNITNAANDLRRELTSAQSDITRALANMEQGLSPSGIHAVGPLGHQAPFDIAKATSRLQTSLDYAQTLGCSQEDINTAYATKSVF